MHKKLVLILIPLVFMIAFSAFSGLTFATPDIKIGIIGPVGLPHWTPGGMWDAARMARDEINAAGGIDVGGTKHLITLVEANEWAIDPDAGGQPNPSKARQSVRDLVSAGVQFMIGGFRTEVAQPIIDELYNVLGSDIPFFIDGASTNELISTTVSVDYAKYKYLFRITPINSTMLVRSIIGYLQYHLIPAKLLPMYGQDLDNNPATPKQIRVAVLTEALAWADVMHYLLTNPAVYPGYLGPNANVTCALRVPENTGEVGGPPPEAYLQNVIGNQSRLLIHVFSGRAGKNIIKKWADMGVQALPVGINVLGQVQTYWDDTAGACEYETILGTVGTRTPVVGGEGGKTTQFWDNFVGNYSTWPIYTAFGAYESIYALKEAIEDVDSVIPNTLVPRIELTNRTNVNGQFCFTSGVQAPYTGQPGKGHDVFSKSFATTWTDGYVRAMFIQWLEGSSGVLTVVCPRDQIYSRKTMIPPWMYPLAPWDVDYNGNVDMLDLYYAAGSFGAYPGNPRWNIEADINADGKNDMLDLWEVARNFGKVQTPWPLP